MAQRVPSLELQLDAVARRFAQLLLGGVVQAVGLDTARDAGVLSVSARTRSGCEAARTAQPSDMSTCARSTKRTGVVACGEAIGQGTARKHGCAARKEAGKPARKQACEQQGSKVHSKEARCAARKEAGEQQGSKVAARKQGSSKHCPVGGRLSVAANTGD